MHEKYYTPEQMAQLKARGEQLGTGAIKKAEQDWKEIFAKMKAEMDKGTDPSDEAVQVLVRRSQELIEAFTGGDPGITQSLTNMYKAEGPKAASQGMIDPEIWAYMAKARAAGSK